MQIDLLRFLSAKFGRVSYERVLSGPGLVNVYEFLRQMRKEPEPKWLAEELKVSDPAVVISQAALSGRSGLCERALDLFMEVYAAEAGNCALRFSAFNGLFIAGGIAMKVLPKFQEPAFLKTFTNKGRMAEVLRSIPVSIVKNESIGLLGAAQYLSADGIPLGQRCPHLRGDTLCELLKAENFMQVGSQLFRRTPPLHSRPKAHPRPWVGFRPYLPLHPND